MQRLTRVMQKILSAMMAGVFAVAAIVPVSLYTTETAAALSPNPSRNIYLDTAVNSSREHENFYIHRNSAKPGGGTVGPVTIKSLSLSYTDAEDAHFYGFRIYVCPISNPANSSDPSYVDGDNAFFNSACDSFSNELSPSQVGVSSGTLDYSSEVFGGGTNYYFKHRNPQFINLKPTQDGIDLSTQFIYVNVVFYSPSSKSVITRNAENQNHKQIQASVTFAEDVNGGGTTYSSAIDQYYGYCGNGLVEKASDGWIKFSDWDYSFASNPISPSESCDAGTGQNGTSNYNCSLSCQLSTATNTLTTPTIAPVTTSSTTPTLTTTYANSNTNYYGYTNFRIADSASDCTAGTNLLTSGRSQGAMPGGYSISSQATTFTPTAALALGTHYWCASNTDGGLSSAWSTPQALVIDITPPTLTKTETTTTFSATLGDATSAKYAYLASAGACTTSADTSNWASYTAGMNIYPAANDLTKNGTYACIVAADDAGNKAAIVSASPIASADTTAPTGGDFTINSGASFTKTLAVTLNLTCPTDTTAVEVAYGTSAAPTNWETCAATKSLTLTSGDGAKTVYVRFRDSATTPNVTSDLTKTITLDATSPSIAFTDNASATNVNADTLIATVSDTHLDIAKWGYTSTTCSVDPADYANTYTSGSTISVASAHTDYVCVIARDHAGNIATLKSDQLHVTPAGPAISAFTLGKTLGNSTSVPITTLTATAQNPSTVAGCRITETDVAPAAGDFAVGDTCVARTYTLSSTTEGAHTLYVWAKDSDDRISAAPTTATFTLDTTPPTVNITPTPGTFTTAQNVACAIATGDGTIYYTTDGTTPAFDGDQLPTGTTQTYTAPVNITTTTTFKYLARDPAGNASTVQTAEYVITLTAPVHVVASFPSGGELTAPTSLAMVGVELNVPLDTTTESALAAGTLANGASSVAKFYACSSSTCSSAAAYPAGTWKYIADGTKYRLVLPLTSTLTTNTYYAFDIGTLAKNGGSTTTARKLIFKTNATALTGGTTAPTATAGFPQIGQTGVPRNIKALAATFSQPMDAASLTTTTFAITPTVASPSVSYDSATQTAFLSLGATLAASTKYTVSVTTGAKSALGLPLSSALSWSFTTGTGSDTTAPSAIGASLAAYKNTAGAIVAVPRAVGTIGVAFDRALLASTVTAAHVKLYQNDACSGTEVTGTVVYRMADRAIGFTPAAPLAAATAHRLCISTAVKSVSDVALASLYTLGFTTANTADDTTKPSISFVEADNYGVKVYFTEPVSDAAAEIADNYTLKVGAVGTFGTAWNAATTLSLANATLDYDTTENAVTITGLSGLVPTQDFLVQIGTGVADLAGNAFADPLTLSDATPDMADPNYNPHSNPYRGIIADSTKSYTATGTTNFSSNTNVSYVPSAAATPGNRLAGQTTTYGIDLPIATQIPASGYIYVKFPAGFDVSGAKRDTNSSANNDLNGAAAGTVTFASSDGTLAGFGGAGGAAADGVSVNTTTNTVAIRLAAVATNAGGYDLLHFDLAGIRSSSTPKDYGTDGYTLTLKTIHPSSGAILETIATKPFFLKAGEDNSLTVTLDLGGTNDGGASTADVYLNSPLTGPLTGTTDAFNAASTNTDATVTFSNIPAGEYQIFTKPTVTLNSVDYAGQATPQTFKLNAGANTKTLTLTKLSGGTTASLVFSATCNTALSSESALDLFANHPTAGFVVKTVTGSDLCSGAASARTLKVPTGGTWSVGFGLAVPRGVSSTTAPVPTGWMPPPSQNVTVTDGGTATATFVANQTMQTITGSVVDTNGKAIASAEVYAYSPTDGLSSRVVTGTDGAFTLSVARNTTYIVGANVSGMSAPKEQSVKVAAADISGLTITIAKGARQITGTVLSGDGSAPSTAFVSAYRTDAPGQANAQIDAQGGFTLYVAPGTWKVGANIPGQPPLAAQEVTVSSGSDPAALSFTATAVASLATISGTITRDGQSAAGIFVDASNTTARNSTTTAADGTYELKVPAGTYTVRVSAPDIGLLGESSVVAGAAYNLAVTTKTLTFTFATNGLTLPEVVIDATDTTNKRGGHIRATDVTNSSTLILTVPAAGTYDLRVNVPGMKLATTDISESDANLNYTNTTGSLVVTNSGALTVTIPVTTRTVTGTVTAASVALADAWVEATSATTKAKVGARTDSSGAYSLQLADGTYYFEVKKSGYTSAPTQAAISAGATTVALSATATTASISGTLSLAGTAAATGFVWAERYGGGYASTPVALDGTWSLSVGTGAWRVFGIADGYAQKEASSCIAIATTGTTCTTTTTGVALNLTTTVSLNTPATVPVTPAAGGTVSDGGTGFTLALTIPANALGSDTNSGAITAKETTNAPKTETAIPLGGKAKEVKATDASGSSVTTLASAATIEFTYTKSELDSAFATSGTTSPTLADVNNLTLSYWDETTLSWVTLPTTVTLAPTGVTSYANVTSATLRGTTTHFSLFSAIVSAISSTVSASAPRTSSSGGGGGGGGGGSSYTSTPTPTTSSVVQTVTQAVSSAAAVVANTFSSVSANVGKTLTALTAKVTGVHEKVATLSGTPVETVLTVENSGKAKSFTDVLKSALGSVTSFLANLTIGDRLKTNAKDGVAVTVAQVADVRMDKNTDVEIGDIAATSTDAGVKLKHHAGQAWYKFKKVSTGEPLHEITTATTVATIRGTSVNVETAADGSEVFTLAEGQMSLTDSATNKVTVLNAGESYIRKTDGTVSVVKNGVTNLAAAWRTSNTSADTRFADFADVKKADWYYAYVTTLRQLGVIAGKTASGYAPAANLTRAEILKIALTAAGVTTSATYLDGAFSDVSAKDWYAPYVASAVKAGIVKGYADGTFRPNQPVNRAEAVKILVAAKKLAIGTGTAFKDVSGAAWYAPYVATAKTTGIVGGYSDGTFRPEATVNRAEIAKMAVKLLEL